MSRKKRKSPDVPFAKRADDRAEPLAAEATPLAWLLPAVLALAVMGYVTFRTPGTMVRGNELSVERAIFTSINAVTLTGFQQAVGVEQYSTPGLATAFVLTVCAAVLSLTIGGCAVLRVAKLRYTDWDIFNWSAMVVVGATMVGFLGLLLTGRGSFPAIFQAASAVANSGLHVGSPIVSGEPAIVCVLMPLATLGGIGITVIMELCDRILGRGPGRLSAHAMSALTGTAVVFLAGTIVLLLVLLTQTEQPRLLLDAATTTLNARTAGLPIETLALSGKILPWLVIVVMLIGGSPGGTAGGVKVTTLDVVGRGLLRSVRGEAPGRTFGIAAMLLIVYASVGLVAFVMLCAFEPGISTEKVAFIVASALSNCGLSGDPISITGGGLYILSATMLLGKAIPIAALWWQASVERGEEIAVG